MDLIDVHCHILPKVDDGPDSVEEAVGILKEMSRQGVMCAVVTPHYRAGMFEPSMKRVLYSYKKMKEIAGRMGIVLRLGCEYYRNEDMISDFSDKKRPTMAGSRCVLVEFSANDMYTTIQNYVYELTTHGFRPIIAHVERYFCCHDVNKIQGLKDAGALIQLNAGSVLGEDGWRQKRFCGELLRMNLVDFIASDTHNTGDRKLNLRKCASYVSRKFGKIYARKIFYENPLKIWRMGG